jgi:hypothetical protein
MVWDALCGEEEDEGKEDEEEIEIHTPSPWSTNSQKSAP